MANHDESSNEHSGSEAGPSYTRSTSTMNSPETQAVLTPRRFRGETIVAHSTSTGKLRTMADSDVSGSNSGGSRRPSPFARSRSNSAAAAVAPRADSDDISRGSSFDSILNGDFGGVDEEAIAGERARRGSHGGPVSALGRLFGSRAAGNGGEYYALEPMGGSAAPDTGGGMYRRRASEPIWSRRMLVLPAIMFASMGLVALVISTLAWARERRENPSERVDAQLFPAAVDASQLAAGQYALRLVHTNDNHAHVEPFDALGGGACDPRAANASAQCVGGAAYVKAVVDHLRGGRGVRGAVVVDAGDAVEGTMYDSLFAGNASAAVLNALRFDAVSLGNHEFDRGLDHLARYLSGVRAPALCANLDFTRQLPALQAAVQPFTVVERHHLGIIGVLTPDTALSSSLGVGVQLTDPTAAVNAARARLAQMGVNRVVVLSHLGYDADRALAARADPGIALIVGAHTHTYLGGNRTGEDIGGAYPTWVASAAGADWQTAVVQAKSFGQYVGYLDLVFNDDGSLDSRLTRGAPVPVAVADASSPTRGLQPSKAMERVIRPFVEQAHATARMRIGEASAAFPAPASNRDARELALANLAADALVWFERHATVSLFNTGMLRAGLPAGALTRGSLFDALPFDGALAVANVTGAALRAIIGRAALDNDAAVLSTAQFSGLRAANGTVRVRTRIDAFDARPFAGEQWETVDDARTYAVLMPQFVANGGDGIVKGAVESRVVSDRVRDVVELYVTRFSPIAPILDQRKPSA
ncbi:hypothetical protein IWW55_002631 [Coemansia sp. RSA 2706]|nr:hypothetical protein IWW55_002631 [Coemansia sp. RSA 2706]KAJ2327944.1 hypothetical protein IWW51_001467 [Coemansia sp. RSA 2702]